jgi:hypothetical protein
MFYLRSFVGSTTKISAFKSNLPEGLDYLIILVQLVVLILPYQFSHFLVAKAYAIIEITQPYNCVVIFDRFIFLKSQTVAYRCVVSVPFIVIRKSCGKMSCDEAEFRIRQLETDGASTFIASHSRKTGLEHAG